MKALNSRPLGSSAPDLSVPVNRADILRMAQTDTGILYQPNQINITPSGAASSLGGGAVVEVNEEMTADGAGEIINGKSITLVFGADGKLVTYNGPFNLDTKSKN